MRCPKCKSEIGNLSKCPYCSTVLTGFDREMPYGSSMGETQPANTIPTFERQMPQPRGENNISTLCLMGVILLTGIFIMEFLQLILLIIA